METGAHEEGVRREGTTQGTARRREKQGRVRAPPRARQQMLQACQGQRLSAAVLFVGTEGTIHERAWLCSKNSGDQHPNFTS